MKKLVVVSDLHCGSFYGLLPPDFITFEGVQKLRNSGQKYLWECWLDFVTRVESFGADCVIVNGDCVDGLQRKNGGAELSLASWKDQRDACIKTLKVLRAVTKKAKWFFTQGTPYHVDHFGDAEESIAEAMGASTYPSLGSGKMCRETLTIEIEGVLVESAHHIGFASVYPSTPLQKEIHATLADAIKRQRPLPDLQIRSHVHNHTEVNQAKQTIVTSPCWQLQTRYARKASVHRLQPDIGGLLIEIDGAAKKKGQRCCRIYPEMYDLPALEVAKL